MSERSEQTLDTRLLQLQDVTYPSMYIDNICFTFAVSVVLLGLERKLVCFDREKGWEHVSWVVGTGGLRLSEAEDHVFFVI